MAAKKVSSPNVTGRWLAEEFLALQQQPGYTRKIGDEWLRSRRKVFRMYLEELKGDFRRLHARARATVAHAPEESHELVGVLIRQQMIFWVAVTMVELRFACARLGFRQVDIRPLLATLDAMRLDLDRFAPQPA